MEQFHSLWRDRIFFLLHYEKSAQTINTPADKENVIKRLKKAEYCPEYEKGDKDSTWTIAKKYDDAIVNGYWSLKQIEDEIGTLELTDERNKKLFFTDRTFSNAFEGVVYLLKLRKNKGN